MTLGAPRVQGISGGYNGATEPPTPGSAMATFQELMRIAELTVKDKTSSKRMGEIMSILKTYDVRHGITPQKAVRILEELGPTYVKMGQIASNRSDLLPKEYCEAFEKLRANVPPIPFDTVIATLERAYNKPWGEVFTSIEEKPLGSASIAQVHRATLLDGSTVAVKVRRPGIVQQMAEDIMLMKHALALAAFATDTHDNMILTAEGFVAELERTTSNELDFTVELDNLVRFYDDMQEQDGVTSPIPYPQLTCDDVLVMEFVAGQSIDEAARADKDAGNALGSRLAQSYITQVVDNGFFHADPHPGNILVNDGQIVWIDLGMTGSLTSGERALVNKALQALATQNVFDLKEALLGLSKADGEVDHGQLMGQIANLLNQYGTSDLSDLNVGQAFLDVIEVLRSQGLIMTPSVTMLARGLLTLEGVLSDIAPDVKVLEIVSEHVAAQIGDPHSLRRRARELAGVTADSLQASAKLPRQLSNSLTMLNRGQLKVNTDLQLPSDFMQQLSAIVGTLALSLISMGLFIGSSVLCTTSLEPRIGEVPLLGILGYVGAFILSVYVVVRARSKKK